MKESSVESFKAEDWVAYFKRRVKATFGNDVSSPRGVIRKSFERLLDDLEGNACLLAVVIDELFSKEDSFIHVVGANERLLTIGVVANVVRQLGGFEQPWDVLYYRRFARTEEEREYFRQWLGLLQDAKSAPQGSEARIGEDLFSSWGYVEKLARFKLDKAVSKIQQRFQYEGAQEEQDWHTQLLPEVEEPELVRMVKEQHGV